MPTVEVIVIYDMRLILNIWANLTLFFCQLKTMLTYTFNTEVIVWVR